jgi:hypothetical protein
MGKKERKYKRDNEKEDIILPITFDRPCANSNITERKFSVPSQIFWMNWHPGIVQTWAIEIHF